MAILVKQYDQINMKKMTKSSTKEATITRPLDKSPSETDARSLGDKDSCYEKHSKAESGTETNVLATPKTNGNKDGRLSEISEKEINLTKNNMSMHQSPFYNNIPPVTNGHNVGNYGRPLNTLAHALNISNQANQGRPTILQGGLVATGPVLASTNLGQLPKLESKLGPIEGKYNEPVRKSKRNRHTSSTNNNVCSLFGAGGASLYCDDFEDVEKLFYKDEAEYMKSVNEGNKWKRSKPKRKTS